MLRVCKSYLSENNGRLSFKGKPFYGLSYLFDQEGLIKGVERIANGKVVGLYRERINPKDKETPRVHMACLMCAEAFYSRQQEPKYYQEEHHDEDSQYVFRGELFEGYAYIFNNDGILVSEIGFADGVENTPFINYYPSGIIKKYKLLPESKEWYEDGRPESQLCYGLDTKTRQLTGISFAVRFKEDGKLTSLMLEEDYSFNLAELKFVAVAERLHLYGSAIDDQVLDFFTKKKSYVTINDLTINCSKVTADKLLDCMTETIGTLSLTQNKNIDETIVAKIKERYPNCFVDYEEKY